MIPTVTMIVLSMIQFRHDFEVVSRYREEGLIPGAMEKEEMLVSTFEHGISQMDESAKLQRIRQIRDILDNSVQHFFGKDKEVDEWVNKLGGIRKVQEDLVGLSLGPKGWFQRTMKELKDELGYTPVPIGEAVPTEIDAAGNYTSYAVLAHREVQNQIQYGYLPDLDEDTTPNWAMTDQDFDCSYKPRWWSRISMGMFRRNIKNPGKNLIQRPTGSGRTWVPDIRIGDEIGGRFKSMLDFGSWSVLEDNPVIKNFIHRFYNDPVSLTWMRVGTGNKTRWACGMVVKAGKWLWSPVTYKSSQTMDWMKENEGKPYTPWIKRAMYVGQWIIVYHKKGDKILAIKMKQNYHSGLLEVWRESLLTPQEWGQTKKALFRAGARDAYFGYPERVYKAPTPSVSDVL